jgi:hypothetical protein
MRTNEEIEAYLLQMGRDFTSAGDGVWVIHDDYQHIENIAVCYAPPVITFRVKLMELPQVSRREALFEKLLRLNASEMIAGAYGIENNSIVIVDTLQAENLDMNELQASVDGLSLAISMHFPLLQEFLVQDGGGSSDARALADFDAQLEQEG